MSKRAIAFVLLSPLFFNMLAIAAFMPSAFILPPDLLYQLVFSTPIFAVLVGVATPYTLKKLVLSDAERADGFVFKVRLSTIALNLFILAFVFLSIVSGYALTNEAMVIAALIEIAGCAALIKLNWTRPNWPNSQEQTNV